MGRKHHVNRKRNTDRMKTPKGRPDNARFRKIFSDPIRVRRCVEHLETLLESSDKLKGIRFPPKRLMKVMKPFWKALERIPDSREEAVMDLIRETVFPPLLTPGFIRRTEEILERYAVSPELPQRDVDAAVAGLYFVSFYRKHPDVFNPLWKVVLDVSWREAMEGRRFRSSGTAGDQTFSGDITGDFDLTDAQRECLQEAVSLIDRHGPDVVFSLETILLGLVTDLRNRRSCDDAARVAALRKTYAKEIGPREVDDLVSGLAYLERSGVLPEAGKRAVIIRKGVRMLPVSCNPVVFSIYFICIRDFYRYLEAEDLAVASALTERPDDMEPVVSYAFALLKQGILTRAVKAFDALAALLPEDPRPEFGAGLALWLGGSCREARLRWRRAARAAEKAKKGDLAALCDRLSGWEDDKPLPPETDEYLDDDIFEPGGNA